MLHLVYTDIAARYTKVQHDCCTFDTTVQEAHIEFDLEGMRRWLMLLALMISAGHTDRGDQELAQNSQRGMTG